MSSSKTTDDLFRDFREAFEPYIPSVHTEFFTRDDLDLFVRARFEFLREKTGDVKINIYNPAQEFFWLVNSTVVECIIPDSRFVVETIVDYCAYYDYQINLIIHPPFTVRRDSSGKLESVRSAIGDAAEDETVETVIYLEVARLEDAEIRRMQTDLQRNYKDLRSVVGDYGKMLEIMQSHSSDDEEVIEMMKWLQRYFVMLGAARLDAGHHLKSPLGIFRAKETREALASEAQQKIKGQKEGEVFFYETRLFSNVNKHKPYYLIVLKDKGEHKVLAGHFTSRADSQQRTEIPIVRRELDRLAARLKAASGSFTRKEILRVSLLIPVAVILTRRSLFHSWVNLVLLNLYSNTIEYVLNEEPEHNTVWFGAVVPNRDARNVPARDFYSEMHARGWRLLHHIRREVNRNSLVLIGVDCGQSGTKEIRSVLEENSDRFFSSWSARFRRLVQNRYVGDRQINRVLSRYFRGISPEYEVHLQPEDALIDLEAMQGIDSEGGYRIRYHPAPEHARDASMDYIKVYAIQSARLSDLVPILNNFGCEIHGENTFSFKAPDMERYMHAFKLPARPEFTPHDRERIAEAIERSLNRKSAPSILDGLVITARLDARELVLLKALLGYYYQIDKSFSRLSLMSTLVRSPVFVRHTIDLFHARLSLEGTSADEKEALAGCEASLAEMESVAEENVFRNFLRVILAIRRTNYYNGGAEFGFKIDSRSIEQMPEPVPFVEIYVYGYDIEGIHLRGGMVARGGLRWSDRPDDFRTEVLGLMKAQMVKNTVIVPVGSKGGFIIKNRRFSSRQEHFEAGKETYQRYINTLLELTDNRDGEGNVIPAPNIRRLDDDDPYLVVAADKGTATFSDLANAISTERGFWLDDAFASGGANGYDHKKQGITARGAWESVRRLFYEMGRDPERDIIRIVGIGDMGGDVFGNGLLLSRSAKLVAAFNHLYIFLDPDPDPEKSYNERQRLFDGALNWNEYDASLISKGGGVFDRNSKKIELSTEVRNALGTKTAHCTGEELIQMILRAPVDLLWNGGIGTYVKAESETDYQAHDPANDRVRVNGNELRVKVVGEGGNLGLTQAGRIEAAANGVRLNTDAIDNSAGVDMSDHEVNLKILLQQLVQKGSIKSTSARNALIRKLDSDEIDLVLAHNIDNNIGLSLDERRVPEQFFYARALIKRLNALGLINRQNDNLPFEQDLDRIESSGRTLVRPVLCSLMGFTKLQLATELQDSEEFYDPWFDRFILRYFPEQLVKQYEGDVRAHPLKRDIVITEVVNDVINNAGMAYFQRMHMRTGREAPEIAVVYMRLADFMNLYDIRDRVCKRERSDKIPADIIYAYLLHLEENVFRINKRVIESAELMEGIEDFDSKTFRKILEEARQHSQFRIPRNIRGHFRQVEDKVGEVLLECFRLVDVIEDAFQVYLSRSREIAWDVSDYFQTVAAFRLDDLRAVVGDLSPESSWEILFLSRIDARVESMLASLLDSGIYKAPKSDERRIRVIGMIESLLSMHGNGTLSPSAFYEMLEAIIGNLETR